MNSDSIFSLYFKLGLEHITDLAGYDHILFLVALCAIYQLKEWRKVAILVTAFTIGHCITLALASLGFIGFPQRLTEFFIPITILLTAAYNITWHTQEENPTNRLFNRPLSLNYLLAMTIGLIHGLGFSNFFKQSLFPGEEDQLVWQLLFFNLGVELGQLIIVGIILIISLLLFSIGRVKQRDWTLFISGMASGPALIMAIERWPFA